MTGYTLNNGALSGLEFSVIVRSDIWQFDGNVVLQAENIQFRVHKSVLAANSVVFKDMFTMVINHLKMVKLLKAVQLFRYLIRPRIGAMYSERFTSVGASHYPCLVARFDGYGRYFVASKKYSLPITSSILKLSAKYLMDDLREVVLAVLHTTFFHPRKTSLRPSIT